MRRRRNWNTIRGPAFGPLDGSGSTSWRETFASMVEDVLVDGERRSVDLGLRHGPVGPGRPRARARRRHRAPLRRMGPVWTGT